MAQYRYSYTGPQENTAKSVGRDLDISFKQAIEITGMIKGKDLEKAQAALERVLRMEQAVPFKRFTNGLGHKPGIASGRYPLRACAAILKLLKETEANAQTKGLGKCRIVHIRAQKAARPMHYGRRTRTRMRRAHVEVVVQEVEAKQKREKKDLKAAPEAGKPADKQKEEKT